MMILSIILIALAWGLSLMVSYNYGRLMQIKKDNSFLELKSVISKYDDGKKR